MEQQEGERDGAAGGRESGMESSVGMITRNPRACGGKEREGGREEEPSFDSAMDGNNGNVGQHQ